MRRSTSAGKAAPGVHSTGATGRADARTNAWAPGATAGWASAVVGPSAGPPRPASGANPPRLPESWTMLPPRTVVRRSPIEQGPPVPSSAAANALATRTSGGARTAQPAGPGPGPGPGTTAGPITFGAPAGSPHVVRRFFQDGEGGPDMSMDLDFAQFDNSGVDKTAGVGEPGAGAPAPDAWLDAEGFRWAVLRIIDERLREETERRAWRRGSEVF